MATNFPASLDTFTNPAPTDNLSTVSHSGQHDNINDAMAQVQAKIGVNGSAVTTSLDYLVKKGVILGGTTLRSATSIATIDPNAATSTITPGSSIFIATYLNAPISFTTTQARFVVTTATSTGAATVGLFSVAANDDITLLTTITATTFASLGGATVTWTTPQAITAGSRYAIGVCGNAGYALAAQTTWNAQMAGELGLLPALSALKTGVATCASQTRASMTNTTTTIYAVLL